VDFVKISEDEATEPSGLKVRFSLDHRCAYALAAPEPLVYKDADAPHSYSSSETLCVSRECWNGKHNECKTVGCACAHHLNSSMTIDLPPVQLYSWEQIEAAISGVYDAMLADEDGKILTTAELLADIRARLTARERVTVEYREKMNAYVVMLDGEGAGSIITQRIDANRYANGLRQELAKPKAKEGK
jgi:hypothetical protein